MPRITSEEKLAQKRAEEAMLGSAGERKCAEEALFQNERERERVQEALRESERERKRIEAELNEIRIRYQSLVGTIDDFSWEMDAGGRFTYCSPRIETLWGIKPEDMIGKSPFDSMPPEERQRAFQAFARLIESPRAFSGLETPSFDGQGRTVYLDVSGIPFFDDQGKLLGYRGTSRDITARKKAEEELARTNQKLTQVLDSIQDDFYVLDRNWVFVYANRNFTSRMSKEPSDFIGKSIWEVFPKHVGTVIDENLHATMDRREIRRFEIRGVYTNVWYCITSFPSAEGITVLGTDITERKRVEEELFESRQYLSALMDAAPVGMSYSDSPDSQHIVGNPTMMKQFEMTLGDNISASAVDTAAAGRQVRYFRDGRELTDAELPLQRAVAENSAIPETELEILLPSGRRWFCAASGAPIRNSEGRTIGGIAVTMDITDRKLAEEALAKRSAELETVLDSLNDAVFVCDASGDVVRANQAARDLYGMDVTGERGIVRANADLRLRKIDGTALPLSELPSRRALRGERVVRAEYLFDGPDGADRVGEASAIPLLVNDKMVGVVAIARDITESKRAEAALRSLTETLEERVVEQTAEIVRAHKSTKAERQRFLDVLETLPIIIKLLRPDFRVEWVNRAHREALGSNVGQICFASLFGRDRPCEECEAFVPLETGRPHRWGRAVADGRIFDSQSLPFADADGSPMILEMDVDVTENRRAEAALRQAHEELAVRAGQLRALAGELTISEQRERRRMAKILHDHLQQLLVGAKFRLTVLGRHVDPVVQQAAGEVERLLDESIQSSRSLTAELSPPILQEAGLVEGLQWLMRWMADNYGMFVNLEAEEDSPSLGEDVKILLFEAVRELLFNAVKHSRMLSARVNVRQAGGQVCVVVSDQGVGFDPHKLPPAGEDGGGFGLFSIRERLGLIGGHLEIDSAPGKGSRFVVTAPLGSPLAAPSQKPESEVSASGAAAKAAPSPISGARIRIMLADDHVVMREGLARLLGVEPDLEVVGQAADGKAAVELAAQLQPDVILMDMSMPKLNGVEATRAIHNSFPDIAIIGLSMFEEPGRAQALRDAGAVDYLTKSGPPEELVAAIHARAQARKP